MKKGQEKQSSSGQRNFGARLKNLFTEFRRKRGFILADRKRRKVVEGGTEDLCKLGSDAGRWRGHFSFMVSYPGAQARGSGGVGGGDWRLIGTGH